MRRVILPTNNIETSCLPVYTARLSPTKTPAAGFFAIIRKTTRIFTMTAAAKIALIAPDYAGLSNLADYIELAEDAVASDMCQRELAVAYMTAHIIAMAERGGKGSGAVTSKGEGGLSIGYSGSQSQSLLSSTAYGQEFERIQRSCGRKGGFVMRTF